MAHGFTPEWVAAHNARMATLRDTAAKPEIHPAGGNSPAGRAKGERRKRQRGAPGEKPRTSSRDAPAENPLQIAVAKFLDLALPAPLRWLHIPNGELRARAAAGKLKAMGVKPGAADVLILGFHPFIWIELKSASGRLTQEQKDWRDWCRSIGAPWFLCRSIEDVVDALESLQIRLKARL